MADGYYETIRDEYGNQEKRWVNTGDEYLEIYDPGYGITYKIANPNYRPPAPMSQYSGQPRADAIWTDIGIWSNDPNYHATMGWRVNEYEPISASMAVPQKGKYEVKENLWDNTIDKSYSRYTQYEDGKPVRSWTEYPEEHGSSGGIGGFVSSYVNPLGAYVPQVALAAPVIAASILQPELAPAMAGFMGASQGYGSSGAGSREDVSYASGIAQALTRGAIAAGTTALAQGMLSGSTPTGGGGIESGFGFENQIGGLTDSQLAGAASVPTAAAAGGEIPIGASLAEMEALYPTAYVPQTYEAGLLTTLPKNAATGLTYGSPEFFAAGGDLGLTPTDTASLIDISLGGGSAMGLTNTPIQYGSTEMVQQGEALGLTPEQTLSLTDTSLGGVSATDLAGGGSSGDNSSLYKKIAQKVAANLLGKGSAANSNIPSFNISFNPLTAKTWNYTPTNFATSAGADQAGGSTIPGASPFTGIGLLRDQEKKKLGLLPYLRDYIA